MTDDETSSLREAIRAYYADPEQQAEHARKRAEADAALRAKTEGPPWAIVRHSPGKPAPITCPCPTCGWLVAQLPLSPDGEVSAPISLVAGFTNAKRRHPSGPPWFIRGDSARPSPAIRGVVVVTCKCGEDCRIPKTTEAFTDMIADAIRNDPAHPQHRSVQPINWRNRE